jgi:hypothetical protein
MQPNNSTYASTAPYLTPPPEIIFAAGFDDWQKEPLAEHASKQNKEQEWFYANSYHQHCLERYEPREAARRYFDAYPDFARDKFYTTGRRREDAAKAALAKPTAWATKLFKQLDYPNTPAYFYSLHMTHLGLPDTYADPRFIYYQAVVDEIKAAIAANIPKPYYYKLEVGQHSGLHVHLIASTAPPLAHLEGSRLAERVYEPFGLLRYLAKPVAPFTAFNYATYLEARSTRPSTGKGRNVPTLSGRVGVSRQRKKTS